MARLENTAGMQRGIFPPRSPPVEQYPAPPGHAPLRPVVAVKKVFTGRRLGNEMHRKVITVLSSFEQAEDGVAESGGRGGAGRGATRVPALIGIRSTLPSCGLTRGQGSVFLLFLMPMHYG